MTGNGPEAARMGERLEDVIMEGDSPPRVRNPESGVVRAAPAVLDTENASGHELVPNAGLLLPEPRDPIPPAGGIRNDVVEHVIRQLNGLCRDATLNFALGVGRIVITDLYSGKLDDWRSRKPNKERSLRKLAKHPDLPMSPAALYRSLAIYEICERLGIQSWKHVSTTHLRLVLPIQDDEQARLLRAAEANKWTARRLEAEIAASTKHEGPDRKNRGGRKRMSPLRRRIRGIRTLVTTVNRILLPEGDTLEELSPESARATAELLQEVTDTCAAVQSRLHGFLAKERIVVDRSSKTKA